MLDDLPEECAVPFFHGYLDGDWPKVQTGWLDDGRPLTLHGPSSTLSAINKHAPALLGCPSRTQYGHVAPADAAFLRSVGLPHHSEGCSQGLRSGPQRTRRR